jgi:hypothetical protein
MKTRHLAVASIVCAGVVGLAVAPHAQQSTRSPRQRAVVVTVLDRDGKAIQDIAPDQFTVREDGAAREVLGVGKPTDPMSVVLLVDTSDGIQPLVQDIRQGLETFGKTMFDKQPGVSIATMSFGERPTIEADFSTTNPGFQSGVHRIFARTGSGSYFLEAITEAVKNLKKHQAARPVIVAFVSESSPEFSTQTRDQIAESLKSIGAQLWVAVLQGRGANLSEEERNRSAVIGDVTKLSGGTSDMLLSRLGIAQKIADIADRLTSQIVVTYSRPDALIPPERVDVAVKRDGARVLWPHWTGK